MLGDSHVERRGAGNDTIVFHGNRAEATRESNDHARQSTIAYDQIRAGADHMHWDIERQRTQELCEIGCISRAHQYVRGATDAEPGRWRQRRVRL